MTATLRSLKHLCYLAVVTGVLWLVAYAPSEDRDNKLEEALGRQLVLGSDYRTVSATLDSLKIEHSAYQPRDRRIHAIVRNTRSDGLVSASLAIVLTFDGAGRLRVRDFNEVYTGP